MMWLAVAAMAATTESVCNSPQHGTHCVGGRTGEESLELAVASQTNSSQKAVEPSRAHHRHKRPDAAKLHIAISNLS